MTSPSAFHAYYRVFEILSRVIFSGIKERCNAKEAKTENCELGIIAGNIPR